MRAVVVRSPGGPEVLEVRDIPDPEPPFGHVRVKVRAIGVNRADLLQRAGFYPAPKGVPADIPGLEYCGEIDAVGPGATRFSPGDAVYGLVAGGAYAEKLVAHEREVVPLPRSLRDAGAAAAAIPEAFVTALDALVVRGRLRPGERVLIHAVGSGVGTAGLQIARALGCSVIGTSRTADKLDRCREFGLDEGIVVTNGTFAAEVLARTAGLGVDVVLDLVGGAYLPDTIEATASRGRIVLVGLTAGASSEVNLGAVLRKRLELVGTVLRSRPLEEKIEAATLLEKTIGPWLDRGLIKPVVDRMFPLAEVAEAHRYVASNASFGKVLLDATA